MTKKRFVVICSAHLYVGRGKRNAHQKDDFRGKDEKSSASGAPPSGEMNP